MMKQKIMYLLCLLMFAVGIKAAPDAIDENGNFYFEKTITTSYRGNPLTVRGTVVGEYINWKVTFILPVDAHIGAAIGVDTSISTNGNNHQGPNNVSNVQVNGSPLLAQYNRTSGRPSYQWGTFGLNEIALEPHVFMHSPKLTRGTNTLTFTTKADLDKNKVNLIFSLAYNTSNSTGANPQQPQNNPRGNTWFTGEIIIKDSEWVAEKNKDLTKPVVEDKTLVVYRGETYPSTTITATDNKGVTSISADSAPVGGNFTSNISGLAGTLTLSGVVGLESNRPNPNGTVTSTHIITAEDASGNAQTGNLNVTILPQKEAYEPELNPVPTVYIDDTVTPEELIKEIDRVVSSLPENPQNVKYSWEGDSISTTTAGRVTGKVRVTYQDGSYDIVNVEVLVQQPIEVPKAKGSEFTVYRGEIYRNISDETKPFVIATHSSKEVNSIFPTGDISYPPGQVLTGDGNAQSVGNRAGIPNTTRYLIGNRSARVPLKAELKTVVYYYTARVGSGTTDDPYINSDEVPVIIHTKAQTDAYNAVGKTNVQVDKGATLNPKDLVASITKITSTLPNIAQNVTYNWEGTPPSTNTVGIGIAGKVRVIYEDGSYDIINVSIDVIDPICTKPANISGTVLETNFGITDLGRAGETPNSWPMLRKGGWVALESNTKGFVITRKTTAQINALKAQEGMIVYDTDAKCLKLYDGTKWSCFTKPVCPKL